MPAKANIHCPFIDERSRVLCKGYRALPHSILCENENRNFDCENPDVIAIWEDISHGICRERPGHPLGEHWTRTDTVDLGPKKGS